MNLLLAGALILITQTGGDATALVVRNASVLVGKDWYQSSVRTREVVKELSPARTVRGRRIPARTQTISVKFEEVTRFSLQQSARWDSGTAWLIAYNESAEGTTECRAFQGKYNVFGNRLAEDVLLLQLCFTRMYRTHVPEDIWKPLDWRIDDDYTRDPKGVLIEVPLVGRAMPSPDASFVVSKGFFVDAQGREIVKRTGAGLFTEGRERRVDYTEFLNIGQVLRLSSHLPHTTSLATIMMEDWLAGHPPPGFKLRALPLAPGLGTKPVSAVTKNPLLAAEEAFKRKDYGTALKLYSEVIRTAPTPRAYHQRGDCHLFLDDLRNALTDFNESIRLDNRSVEAFRSRGVCNEKLRDFRAAINDYISAVRLDPGNGRCINALARLLATCPDASLRNGAMAVSLAKDACELEGWKNADCLMTLAAAYAASRDYAAAVQWQKKALEAASQSPENVLENMRIRLDMYEAGKILAETRAEMETIPKNDK